MTTQLSHENPPEVFRLTPYAAAGNEPAFSIRLKTFRVTENVPPLPEPHRHTMANPEEAARIIHAVWQSSFDMDRESVAVFTVNARNQITGFRAWHGTVDHSVIYPREVLETCIRLTASGFILAHNHPSGDTSPSQQDIHLTEQLASAARCLGVRFFDHLVLDLASADSAFSFRRSGLLS
jgi:DNA repair protein RadC